jgi:hypothetical protein
MAGTPDLASCVSSNGNTTGGLTPVNPFYALRYQFGMLLGVDDFETEQAYHRGKVRLHNAWLHREGAVWGLDVQLDTARNEIKVTPGMALDAAGHELHLDATACVDVTQWYAAHSKDPGFTSTTTPTGGVQFDAHVVISFQACLTRQVPAMLEPCQNSGIAETAYSRVNETVKLALIAGTPDPSTRPYRRLRLLFWLDPPGTGVTLPPELQEVVDARAAILALPSGKQPHAYAEAFRKFAALDEIELQPAKGPDGTSRLLFPAGDDTYVLLANIKGITLETVAGILTLKAGTIDRTVRPSHVATSTIEELLCGPTFQNNPPTPAAVGPNVTTGSVAAASGSTTITLTTTSPLQQGSVAPQAFSVTFLDSAGVTAWKDLGPGAKWDGPSSTVTLTLTTAPGKGLLRLIARGTGAAPLVGTNSIPLGGTSDSADGQDFVWMKEV